MNNILDKLQKLAFERVTTRLKHLRGKHDQLDHAWNRGMGRGGGGTAPAPNQMGPLPTADFYRKRRVALMDQQRQGVITRAEMRRQMRDLRGITLDALDTNQSDNLTLANRRPVKPTSGQLEFNFFSSDGVKQKIDQFKASRDSERLPLYFDIKSYKYGMQRVSEGVSGVQAMPINGQLYFYRANPLVSESSYQWTVVRGPLKAIVADNIASSLGLPLAPIAQETNEYKIITNGLNFDRTTTAKDVQSDLSDKFAKGEIGFEQLIRFSEPLAVMDLIVGQNDGHSGNINVIKNPNREIYDSEYIATSVDYDLTGDPNFVSTALMMFVSSFADKSNPNNTLLTPEMSVLLNQFIQNPQWHPSIPELARQQYIRRAQELLRLGQMTTDQLEKEYQKIFGGVQEPLTSIQLMRLLTTSMSNQVQKTPRETSLRDISISTNKKLTAITNKIDSISAFMMNEPQYFMPGYPEYEFTSQTLGFPPEQILPRFQSLQQRLLQISTNMSQNISDAEYGALLQEHTNVSNAINELISTWATVQSMNFLVGTNNYQRLIASPQLQSPNYTKAKATVSSDMAIVNGRFTGAGQSVYYDKYGNFNSSMNANDMNYVIETKEMINLISLKVMAIAQASNKLHEFLQFINKCKMNQFAKKGDINILDANTISPMNSLDPDDMRQFLFDLQNFVFSL